MAPNCRWLLGQEHCERDDREEPGESKNSRDAVQVSLGRSRTERGSTATTEHVGKTTAAPAVQENPDDHGEHRCDVDDNGNDRDEVAHGAEL